jgi:hypothetical protein
MEEQPSLFMFSIATQETVASGMERRGEGRTGEERAGERRRGEERGGEQQKRYGTSTTSTGEEVESDRIIEK